MLCTSFILAFGEKGIEFAKLLYKTGFYLSRVYSVSAFCIVSVILKPVSTTETQDAGIWPKHSVIPSTQDDQSVLSHYEGGRERRIEIHFVGGE